MPRLGRFDRCGVDPTQDPHEEELHDVGVDEEELRPTVALGAGDGVAVGGVFGEEHVFERAELSHVACQLACCR